MDITNVYRHEIKFLMSRPEYKNLKCMLETIMKKDENSRDDKDYYIRSLYFDSVTNIDYFEKLQGDFERKKIRLRIYDLDTEFVKLEVKNKKNDYSLKETITIKKEDALKLQNMQYEVLLGYDNSIAKKVYNIFTMDMYRPKVIIDYDREAYFLPIENIRLTFDKNVRATKKIDIFNDNTPMCAVLPRENMILEVKYDRFLPKHISQILSSVHMQRMSISKYCLSRDVVS